MTRGAAFANSRRSPMLRYHATALLSLMLAQTPICLAYQLHATRSMPSCPNSKHTVVMLAAKKSKKPKAKSAPAGGGFGKAGSSMKAASGPTPEQLLKKSMSVYEELEVLQNQINAASAAEIADEAEDESDGAASAQPEPESEQPGVSVSKYAVAMRSTADGASEFSDWVPIALLALACGSEADVQALLPSAIGASVREVIESGAQAFPSLRKVARETLEYSYESIDSFEAHVFTGLQGRAERRSEAATTLGIEPGASAADVKKAHRKLMQELHPDKFIGDEEGAEAAKARMLDVQEAYAELGGGQGAGSGSFYEKIGGKARVDFSGALPKEQLAPMGKPRDEQQQPFVRSSHARATTQHARRHTLDATCWTPHAGHHTLDAAPPRFLECPTPMSGPPSLWLTSAPREAVRYAGGRWMASRNRAHDHVDHSGVCHTESGTVVEG